nr:hypothetical protein Iba_chr11fCG10850 [Ipomoea batatas]
MATNDSENLIIPQVDRPMKVIQKLQAQCVFDRRATAGRLKRQSDRGVLATGVERAVGDLQREGRHQGLTAGRRAGGIASCSESVLSRACIGCDVDGIVDGNEVAPADGSP